MKNFRYPVIAAVFLGTVLSTGVFAAGNAEGGQASGVTLNFWYWDQNGEEAYKQIISEFEKANPGIKINMSIIPWDDYWTKLQTALPTGTGPDVFWLNHPNAVTYIPTGLLMDLTPASGEIKFENFDKNFYTPFSQGNKVYGVPVFYDSIVLYYNKALFDKAGVPYPTGDWTWKEYLDAAAKLTVKKDGKTVQYGTVADSETQSGSLNFILENGGKVFSPDRMKCVIDSPEAREAIQFQLDLIHKYAYAPTIQEIRESNLLSMFQSGLVAMLPNLSAHLKPLSDVLGKDLGIAPLPKQKQRASTYHNLAYVAATKTKHPGETQKFLAFLASKRHAEILSKVWMPCYRGAAELYLKQYNWLDTKYITEAISYGYPLQISGRNAGQVYTLLANEMEKLYLTPQVGVDLSEIAKVINAEIAK